MKWQTCETLSLKHKRKRKPYCKNMCFDHKISKRSVNTFKLTLNIKYSLTLRPFAMYRPTLRLFHLVVVWWSSWCLMTLWLIEQLHLEAKSYQSKDFTDEFSFKDARSYFLGIYFLKNHHLKDVNLKFQLKRTSRLDVRSYFVYCSYFYLTV